MDDPQPYIDYEDEAVDSEPATKWTHTALKKYWFQLYEKHHKQTAVSWTIKEVTLLSRMIKEYQPERIAAMIELWMKSKPDLEASNFTRFYIFRMSLAIESSKQEKGYQWS